MKRYLKKLSGYFWLNQASSFIFIIAMAIMLLLEIYLHIHPQDYKMALFYQKHVEFTQDSKYIPVWQKVN